MILKRDEGLLQIRGWFVNFYLLIEGDTVYLIDGGFVGDLQQIEKALQHEGLEWTNIKAVLMTHGHLDHTLNVAKIVEKSGATVYAHPADELHFQAKYSYRGISRICGWLELAGRALFGYTPVKIDREVADGQVLNIWGGLHVLHTPGHTIGHCSFYSIEKRILFSGDLFANWMIRVMLPWPWLNSCSEHFESSFRKVFQLNPEGILANHCDKADAWTQGERFRKRFAPKYGRKHQA